MVNKDLCKYSPNEPYVRLPVENKGDYSETVFIPNGSGSMINIKILKG
jgi:hypothetical protein